MTTDELIIYHYNFISKNEVSKLSEIPDDVFAYLVTLDDNTLKRPFIFVQSQRDISANNIHLRTRINRLTISRVRKKLGI